MNNSEMNNMNRLFVSQVFLLVIILTRGPIANCEGEKSCEACQISGVRSAKYKIARKLPGPKNQLIVDISINKNSFTRSGLSALACQLSRDFQKETKLLVRIFDNPKSAKRYVSRWEQEKPPGWKEDEISQKAYYMQDAELNQRSIAWYNDPLNKKGETSVHLCTP